MSNSVQVSGFFSLAVPGRRKKKICDFRSCFMVSRQGPLPLSAPRRLIYIYLSPFYLTATRVRLPSLEAKRLLWLHPSAPQSPACHSVWPYLLRNANEGGIRPLQTEGQVLQVAIDGTMSVPSISLRFGKWQTSVRWILKTKGLL